VFTALQQKTLMELPQRSTKLHTGQWKSQDQLLTNVSGISQCGSSKHTANNFSIIF